MSHVPITHRLAALVLVSYLVSGGPLVRAGSTYVPVFGGIDGSVWQDSASLRSNELIIVSGDRSGRIQIHSANLRLSATTGLAVLDEPSLIGAVAADGLAGCLHTHPLVSPDGSNLAITRLCPQAAPQTGIIELELSPSWDAVEDRALRAIDWFSDSQNLLFLDTELNQLLVGSETSAPRFVDIPEANYSVSSAALAPDGLSLAYAAFDGLWYLDFVGRQRRIVAGASAYGVPWVEFSPDGLHLAYVAIEETDSTGSLYVASYPFEMSTQLGTGELYRDVQWSPDGRRLAVVVVNPARSTTTIQVVDPTSGGVLVSAQLEGNGSEPVWSPDGTALALSGTNRVGKGSLWVLSADDGSAQFVLDGFELPPAVAWRAVHAPLPTQPAQASLSVIPMREPIVSEVAAVSPQFWVPFDQGLVFTVTTGYDTPDYHINADRYALDFARGCGHTCGHKVRASAGGAYGPDGYLKRKARVTMAVNRCTSSDAGCNDGYGNCVKLDHGYGYASRYAHLEAVAVTQTQEIYLGTVVGTVGNTGTHLPTFCGVCPGGHLHYVTYLHDGANNAEPLRGQSDYRGITVAMTLTSDLVPTLRQIKSFYNWATEGWPYLVYASDCRVTDVGINGTFEYDIAQSGCDAFWYSAHRGLNTMEFLYMLRDRTSLGLPTVDVYSWPLSELVPPATSSVRSSKSPAHVYSWPLSEIVPPPCAGANPNPVPGEPRTPSSDLAALASHITFPSGSIVSPGQSFVKTWRVRNSGTSTWNGFQLRFLQGEQMGGASPVAIPTTTPGQEVNLSVALQAPATAGNKVGVWQIVNSQGVHVQGGTLSVNVNVQGSTIGGHIAAFSADPPSPSSASTVNLRTRVGWWPQYRAMRVLVDNQVIGETSEVERVFAWDASTTSRGDHTLVLEVADLTDTSWSRPERSVLAYHLEGTPGPVNHAPDRPTPQQDPGAYDWHVTTGSAPQICAHATDPDPGNSIQYFFRAEASVGTYDSGWASNSCYTFGSVNPGTYEWRVKARDQNLAESDWSDPWHFTVESSGVTINSPSVNPGSPSSAERVDFCLTTSGHAGVNVDVTAQVNTAIDGSNQGEWRYLDGYLPGGGQWCWWWNTLEYGDGDHRVRFNARAWEPADTDVLETNYHLNHRRPASPRLLAPIPTSGDIREAIYLNSRTITFSWQPTIRAQSYTLHMATTENPQTAGSPVFRQTFDAGVTSHTVVFDQDYPVLYWQVTASNDVGTKESGDQLIGIDRLAPTCSVQPLPATTYETVFQVTWSGSDALAGMRGYDVQYQDTERSPWTEWLTEAPSGKPYELFTAQSGHTYAFRCRATDHAGNTGDYPTSADTHTLVDPVARPPTPWWNPAYANKRNIVVLNNMPGTTLPVGYPVHLHFDSTTTPTAAALYSASLSTPKGNDVRIVAGDVTELDRYVKTFTNTEIDIWLRSQVAVAGGASNDTAHQLYYGNAAAGAPLADINNVLYPPLDASTVGLWHFAEGSGTTLTDSSGHGYAGSLLSGTWASGKFGSSLKFPGGGGTPGVRIAGSDGLRVNAFTFEAWVLRPAGLGNGFAAQGQGGLQRERWQIWTHSGGDVDVGVWPAGGAGSLGGYLPSNTWHHMAVTFDGGNQVKYYMDGNLYRAVTLPGSGMWAGTTDVYIGNGLPNNEGQAERFTGYISGARLSNVVRTSFPYGGFAVITNEPTLASGDAILPPTTGSADLAVLSMAAYPNPEAGLLVQAVVANQGDLPTQSGFYTDLYADHLPTGSGDYSGSVHFWVASPIAAGATITLTTAVSDAVGVAASSGMVASLKAISEVTRTLYAQVDSAGAVHEDDKANNTTSGLPVCIASSDAFEPDGGVGSAKAIPLNESQTHNFDRPGDEDWFSFAAETGNIYTIRTLDLDERSDTYLYLYDTDGTTLLASNDDYGDGLASQIEWAAPSSARFYVLVRHWQPDAGGCGTSYDIELQVSTGSCPSLTWTSPTNMPIPRWLSGAAASGDKIYVIGGVDETVAPINYYSQAVDEYDPLTNLWAARASMPNPINNFGIAVGPGGEIYTIGGDNNNSWVATVQEYDPAGDAWRERAGISVPRVGVEAVSHDGGIYAFGGLASNWSALSTVEKYDPQANTWASRADMPTPRWDTAVVAAANGRIYVIGGTTAVLPTAITGTVEEYDPVANTWRSRASLPVPRTQAKAVSGNDGRIYVIGGQVTGEVPTDLVDVYDPSTDSWCHGGSLPEARTHFSAARMGDGVYVFGGQITGGNADTVLAATIGSTCTGVPLAPSSPIPPDGAVGVSVVSDLSWSGGHSCIGETVTYDVFLDADDATPQTKVCSDVGTPTCDVGTLSSGTRYYWKVVAKGLNGPTNGSVWDFTTVSPIDTVLYVDPPYRMASVNRAVTVTIAISNVASLGAFEFTLAYSPTLVEVEDVTLDAFPTSTGRPFTPQGPNVDNTLGTVSFGAFSLGATPPGAAGDGGLALVRLMPKTTGQAALYLQSAQVTDLPGDVMPLALQDGQLNIVDNPGDFDDDGRVTISDVQRVAFRWGTEIGDPLYDPLYDSDSDGDIDIADVQRVAYLWGTVYWGGVMSRVQPLAVTQGGEVSLRLEPAAQSVQFGDTFTVAVHAEDVSDLGAFEFTLGYDPLTLEIISADVGSFPESTGRTFALTALVTDTITSAANFGAYSIGSTPDGATGAGDLAIVTMRMLAAVSTVLTIESAQVTDKTGNIEPIGALADGHIVGWQPNFYYLPAVGKHWAR